MSAAGAFIIGEGAALKPSNSSGPQSVMSDAEGNSTFRAALQKRSASAGVTIIHFVDFGAGAWAAAIGSGRGAGIGVRC